MTQRAKAGSGFPSKTSVATISSVSFVATVDEVLVASQRARLEPGGPQQCIITVESSDRVLQTLAGPGSGKTEMLVWRVLFDLFVRGVRSSSAMVTSFTRRAATELDVRVVERRDRFLQCAPRPGFPAAKPMVLPTGLKSLTLG